MAEHHGDYSLPINLLNDELLKPARAVPTAPRTPDGQPASGGFRVGALNVNSIKDNVRRNKVERFVRKHEFDIFVVIESWLISTDKFEHPDNYAIERKDRRYEKKRTKREKSTGVPTEPNLTTGGGGILIYIHESVNYKVKSRGEYAESNVEFLHIEITSPVQLHLVALYSPDKILVDHLISLMSYFMDPLGTETKIMFIGDTNIDKYNKKPTAQQKLGNAFFNVLEQPPYKVRQLIDQITHGKACIDHIFTNMEHLESGVMKNCITSGKGHKGIYCTLRDSVLEQKRKKKEAFIRKLGQELKDVTDTCILAIFCKFPKKVVAPAVKIHKEDMFSMDEELAYYQVVSKTQDMNSKMGKVDKFVTEVEATEQMRQHGSAVHKQCIIFTRNSLSPVFHALQKRMWYKIWDFVWQPRHVEFLGYVLEPSLTYAYPIHGGQCLEDTKVDKTERIRLQESSYRYWSEKIQGKWGMKKLGVSENEA